jgi:proline iminopeptidase
LNALPESRALAALHKLQESHQPHQRREPTRYPRIEPYDSGFLEVDGGHRLYWEKCGNPHGTPALFLHGGPGGGCSPTDRRWFDPQRYCIVLFDQRGCGRSMPRGSLVANTTQHLLDDIEKLRIHCGIERWVLMGGSWGATLALAYGQRFPQRVRAMVLRGVFMARREELHWLYQVGGGASQLFPDAWEHFVAPIPLAERQDLIGAYYTRLTCGDAAIETAAAGAWCAWEDRLTTLLPAPPAYAPEDPALLTLARIECHYFKHAAFVAEGQLLADAHLLRGIAAVIVQGRYDVIAPAASAWDLARAWPQAHLQIVPDGAHASSEPGNLRRLIMATDGFAECK